MCAAWSSVSAAGFALLIIFSIEAVRSGNNVAMCTGGVLIVAGLLFLGEAIFRAGVSSVTSLLAASGPILVATIVVAAAGNLALLFAAATSPNAGYATAVSSIRAGMLYVAWVASRQARFHIVPCAAVLGMLASVALTGA